MQAAGSLTESFTGQITAAAFRGPSLCEKDG